MSKKETPAQGGAGRKRSKDELFKLAEAVLHKKPGTIEVEVQPGQVRKTLEGIFETPLGASTKLAALYEQARQGTDILEGYEQDLADLLEGDEPDEYRLSVGGVGIIPTEGLVAICGNKKQGKTQFLVTMTAVMLSGRPFGSMKRETPPNKVLWIDTEQGRRSFKKCVRRLCHLAGIQKGTKSADAGLHVIRLKSCPAEARLLRIQFATHKYDPDIIVIDGIADLLHDFNNLVDSREVVDWLNEISEDRNVFAVIHTNEGTEKMRGHLGTELGNKCTDIFTIRRVGDHFEATHMAREEAIPGPFAFKFDKNKQLAPVGIINVPDFVSDPDKTLEGIFEGGGVTFPTFEKLCSTFAKHECIKIAEAKNYIKQHYIGTKIEKRSDGSWSLKKEGFSSLKI